MDAYEAALFVQAQACMARVEGMKAENLHREYCGNSIAYGDDSFNCEAATLEHIAQVLRTRAGL